MRTSRKWAIIATVTVLLVGASPAWADPTEPPPPTPPGAPTLDLPDEGFAVAEAKVDEFEDLPRTDQLALEKEGVTAEVYDNAPEILNEKALADAVQSAPPDCVIEVGDLLTEALARCGVDVSGIVVEQPEEASPVEPTEPEQPRLEQAPGVTPTPTPTSTPTSGFGGAGGGGGLAHSARRAVPTTCETVNTGTAIARTIGCTYLRYSYLAIKGNVVTGTATAQFVGVVNLNAKSLGMSLELKIRLVARSGVIQTITFMSGKVVIYPASGSGKIEVGLPSKTVSTSWVTWTASKTLPSLTQKGEKSYLVHWYITGYLAGHVMDGTETGSGFSQIRCDNNAVPSTGTGCIFQYFTPTLIYSKSGAASGVAWHVARAQAWGAPKLLRREYPVGNNRAQICPSSLARPTGYECDEYPFNSTLEGGTTVAGVTGYKRPIIVPAGCKWTSVKPPAAHPFGVTSRCAVLKDQNRAGGSQLNSFYVANRILDGDYFYVGVKS